jgi:hypothetical protein
LGEDLDLGVGGTGIANLTGGLLSVSGNESLGVGSGGTGAFTQTGGTNTVGDTLTVAASLGSTGTYVLDGGMLHIGNSLTVNPGGLLAGSGTVNGAVVNGGSICPGSPLGTLSVNGNYSQLATGTLSIAIGGLTSGTQYDQLAVTANASLSGVLNVSFTNGFNPQVGDQFVVLACGSLAGIFSVVNSPTLNNGLVLLPVYSNTNLILEVIHVTGVSPVPSFSNLTASQSTPYGTTAITLAGKLSATGPIYPAKGESITVTINGNAQSTTIDDATGDFSLNYNPSTIPASRTPYIIMYSYAGDTLLSSATNTGTTLTVSLVTVTWTNPAPIAYGTPLSSNQLNATANVLGSFAYTPPSGTILNAGTNTLSVIFIPADTNDYSSVTKTVSIVVGWFESGSLAVRRVGDGLSVLSGSSCPVFIDQYSTNGSLLNTLPIPSANGSGVTNALVQSGTATSEGYMSLSMDGTKLVIVGYNTDVGVATIASTSTTGANAVPRAVATVDYNGIYYMQIVTTNFSGSNIRSGASDGANNYWATSPLGAYYLGLSSPASPLWNTNTRVMEMLNGTLYCSSASASGVYNLGALPTAGPVSPRLVLADPASSPYDFAFSPNGNLAYYADDNSINAGGGIVRLSFSGGGWTSNYTLPTGVLGNQTNGARSLAVNFLDSTPVIYATTADSQTRLITIVDSGPDSVPVTLATSAANTAFRGVKFVPSQPLSITAGPVSQTVQAGSTVVFSATTSGGASPLAYQWLFDGMNLTNNTYITGSQSNVLTLTSVLMSNAGTYEVLVSNAYGSANASATLTVVQATPIITWTNAAPITYGTALSSIQLNATANVPGSFAYNSAYGTILNAATNTLSVIFTPTDTNDYISVIDSVTVVVLQAPPAVNWPTPAPIPYGTALSSNQLNATANVPGIFAYTPTNGTLLYAGTNTLSVVFTPTDTNDYSSVTDTVSLVVSPTSLSVTAANNGRLVSAANPAFSGTITGVTNGDNITASYACSANAASPAGDYLIVPSLIDPENRQTNYTVTLANGTLAVTNYPTPYTFLTLAGQPGISGTNNGTGSVARFYGPNGVAVDSAGNVYVADRYNYTIREVTPTGVVTTLAGLAHASGTNDGIGTNSRFGAPGGSPAGYYGPTSVTVDGATNIYVSDFGNNTIRKVAPVGTNWVVTTLVGQPRVAGTNDGSGSAARFKYPNGVALDANSNVYVAEAGNNTIRKVAPVGTNWVVTTLAGLAGSSGNANGTNSAARFNNPTSVAVDSAGNVYVTDCNNHTIRKVTPVGTNWVVTTLVGLADSSGAADGTGSTARFYYPCGVAVDNVTNLYVADQDNNTIRKVTLVGTTWVVTTLGGLARVSGTNDGTGSAARFYYDPDVAVDSAGNVYVADINNDTIRKGSIMQFTASPTDGTEPLTVQFGSPSTDSQSNAITQWNWNFGDGSSSTLQNPSHIYTNAGAFQPSLIATNNLGFAVLGSGPSIMVNGNGYVAPFYYSVNAGAITITGYNGVSETVTIPTNINWLQVIRIGANAFEGLTSLTSVTIPGSVTDIGEGAFQNCTSLMSVTIPGSVTNIAEEAFLGCTSLTSVTIPGSVSDIAEGTFAFCTSLASVYFEGNEPSVGSFVFADDNDATAYYPPCTTGWSSTFAGLPAMEATMPSQFSYTTTSSAITITGYGGPCGTVIIPDSINGLPVTSIANDAFERQTSLTSVTIPGSVTNIGAGAFDNCTNLTTMTIASGITSIGDSAFYECYSLTNVMIPGSVTNIGDYAFYFCTNLTSVTIANGVTCIGDSAFYFCTNLTSVTIPGSVTSVSDYAFSYCSGLTSLTLDNGVTSIGELAFGCCTSLTSVTIPGSITNIGGEAFSFCSSLTNVTIAIGVTSIWDSAFFGSGLTSVTIPNTVTNIGDEAFYECFSLTNVMIPGSVTSIGFDAFCGCTNLTSVTIPYSVTSIGEGAFQDSGLTSVIIPGSVTNIGSSAFGYCCTMKAITVDPTNAFYSSYNGVLFDKSQTTLVQYPGDVAGSYTIPASVTDIGDGAFYGCPGLTSVMIPGSITNIGVEAFSFCSSLTSVTIPASVTSIEYYAFYYSSNLTCVYFEGNAPTVGSSVFTGDNNSTVYYLPGTTGWSSTFGGVPTAFWLLPNPLILNWTVERSCSLFQFKDFSVAAAGGADFGCEEFLEGNAFG